MKSFEEVMIKQIIHDVKVFGLNESVKASKYPMSSDVNSCNAELTDTAKKLAKSEKGSGHDQFLTGIIVQFDLKFRVKAWVEAERYHFFDFVSHKYYTI